MFLSDNFRLFTIKRLNLSYCPDSKKIYDHDFFLNSKLNLIRITKSFFCVINSINLFSDEIFVVKLA